MKKKVAEHSNRERWLVSYADFITLLFAFFVVMYSISSVNEGKYRVLSKALESTFKEPVRSLNPNQIGEILKFKRKDEKPLEEDDLSDIPMFELLSENLETTLEGLIQEGLVVIKENKDWIEIVLKSDVLFRSGDAVLPEKGVEVISKIAKVFNNFDNPITVEGYTDNRPIYNDFYLSNWELSANRAAVIANILIKRGIAHERVSAVGYGDNFPIADNRTRDGRAKNRRVIFLINKTDLRKEELKKMAFKPKTKDDIVIDKNSPENNETQLNQGANSNRSTKSQVKMITNPDGSKEFIVEEVYVDEEPSVNLEE